jgi:hypothetical protein
VRWQQAEFYKLKYGTCVENYKESILIAYGSSQSAEFGKISAPVVDKEIR